MALRGKSQIICDFNQTVVGIFQQMLRLFDFLFANVAADRNTQLLLKKP